MTIWRVSNHPSLDGRGGLRTAGRWHHRGRRIVYCAPNPATALLEVLVHLEIDVEDIPRSYQFLEIQVPEATARETANVVNLGVDWKQQPEITRCLGDQWLLSERTALLLVPCVIVPETWNVLINPRHAEAAGIAVWRVHEQEIDRRLI